MTGVLYARVNGQWVPVSSSAVEARDVAAAQWNGAWGVVAVGSPIASQVNVAQSASFTPLTNNLAFNPLTGRRYRVVFAARAMQPTTVNGTSTINLVNTSNAAVLGTSDRWWQSIYGLGYNHQTVSWFIDGSTTADTIRVTTNGPSNTGMTVFPTEFYIEDIGPSSGFTGMQQPNPITQWNAAWGVVAQAIVTADHSGIGTSYTDVNGMTVSFTPVAGRRYRVSAAALTLQNTGTGYVDLTINDGANNPVAHSTFTLGAGVYARQEPDAFVTGLAATPITYKGRAKTTAGTMNVQMSASQPGYIVVEDVGPTAFVAPEPPTISTPPWTAPTFQNSWRNYDNGFSLAGYRKIGDRVELRGLVTGGNAGTTALTLPTDFRPPRRMVFSPWSDHATNKSRVDILTDGQVSIGAGMSANGTGLMDLDNIWFSTTA